MLGHDCPQCDIALTKQFNKQDVNTDNVFWIHHYQLLFPRWQIVSNKQQGDFSSWMIQCFWRSQLNEWFDVSFTITCIIPEWIDYLKD